MIYKKRKELLKALSLASKGDERAQILSVPENRSLIKSSGANVTFYSGEPKPEKSVLKELENVYVGVIQRLNAKTGKPDGIGALGGLSERTNEDDFMRLSTSQKEALVGEKDDVISTPKGIILTKDINIIAKNNVMRETREELGNLGIYDFKFNPEDMHLVDMPEIKDDNFAIFFI